MTPYHLEAAIAFEHCTAKSFEDTNWNRILELYEWLCQIAPSPIAELNKTVAILQVHGPEKAMEWLLKIQEQGKLNSFYLYHSMIGEIHSRLGDKPAARQGFESALKLVHSDAEQKIILNKIADLK